MLSIILQVIVLLLLSLFLICDIVFLILNKHDVNYQSGFGISGFLFFPLVICHGIITIIGWPIPGRYSFETEYVKSKPFGIMLIIYGIIGLLSQIIIGVVFGFAIDVYFLTPILVYPIILVAALFSTCVFYCCKD